MAGELLPVQLGLLELAGPHDRLPRAVDSGGEAHARVEVHAGQDGRERERDTVERVVVVVQDDHAPGAPEAVAVAAVETLLRRCEGAHGRQGSVRPWR